MRHCSAIDTRSEWNWHQKQNTMFQKRTMHRYRPHWTRRVFQRLIRIAERQFFLQRRRCGSQSGNGGDSSQEEET